MNDNFKNLFSFFREKRENYRAFFGYLIYLMMQLFPKSKENRKFNNQNQFIQNT